MLASPDEQSPRNWQNSQRQVVGTVSCSRLRHEDTRLCTPDRHRGSAPEGVDGAVRSEPDTDVAGCRCPNPAATRRQLVGNTGAGPAAGGDDRRVRTAETPAPDLPAAAGAACL